MGYHSFKGMSNAERRYTEEEYDKIRAMRLMGHTYRSIAQELGKSTAGVRVAYLERWPETPEEKAARIERDVQKRQELAAQRKDGNEVAEYIAKEYQGMNWTAQLKLIDGTTRYMKELCL